MTYKISIYLCVHKYIAVHIVIFEFICILSSVNICEYLNIDIHVYSTTMHIYPLIILYIHMYTHM
jgi:hypothetical protein